MSSRHEPDTLTPHMTHAQMGVLMKNRISRIALLGLTATAALTLSACGSSAGGDANGGDTDGGITTVSEGKLTVCSDIPYEPFEMLDEASGEPIGFDIDIVQAVADDMGLELAVVDSSFEAITSGLFGTDCDIAASSITITDERKQNVDFSDPYYNDALVLIAAKDAGITSIDDAKGKTVGVQAATTGAVYAADNGLDPIEFEDSGQQILALTAGNTVASLGNQSVLKFAIKGNDDFVVVEDIPTDENLGIIVPKGKNAEILAEVNKTIKRLTDSGELAELEAKWFEGK